MRVSTDMTFTAVARCTALIATLLFTVLVTVPARAQGALSFDEQLGSVQGWRVGYSKGLAGCFASASFTDGTSIWIGYGVKLQFYIAFTNAKWRNIETGKTYQLTAVPRNYRRWNGSFLGFERAGERGVIISNLKQNFLLDFARAPGMALNAGRTQLAQLSLAGSRVALTRVLDCQRDRSVQANADANANSAKAARPELPKTRKAGSGTGFFVTASGHVLTNHHVAGNCSSLTVSQLGQPTQTAKLVASDQRNDLALLSTDLKPAAVPTFRTRARLGENIAVFGFPLAGLLASGGNFTLGNITALAGLADDSTQYQISAPVQPGNSGGPLLDKSGSVIGVVVSKLNVLGVAKQTNDVAQNVNFAIKAATASNFLETNGVTITARDDVEDLAPADLADKAKLFTVKVLCR